MPKKKTSSVWAGVLNSSDENHVYSVPRTGYYCVGATAVFFDNSDIDNNSETFFLSIDWRNPYGELPAADYPKLPVSLNGIHYSLLLNSIISHGLSNFRRNSIISFMEFCHWYIWQLE